MGIPAKPDRELQFLRVWYICLSQITPAPEFPPPVREFVFDERRKWRFDFAWPAERVAVEVQGGVHTGGRHNRGAGMVADYEKVRAAMVAGWRVVPVASVDLDTRAAQIMENVIRVLQLLR